MGKMRREERRRALTVARLAVGAYAREPSEANAHDVEAAWRQVRRLDSRECWRRLRMRTAPRVADVGAGVIPPGSRTGANARA